MKKIIPVLCICARCGLKLHVNKPLLKKGILCPKCSGNLRPSI